MAPASKSSCVKKTKPATRIQTLKTKSSLLSTLCGASVSFVCLMPNGDTFTWPEDKAELQSILHRYRQRQIAIADAEKRKLSNKKRKRVDDGNEGFDGLSSSSSSSSLIPVNTHLSGLQNLLDAKLECLNEKIRVLEKKKEMDEQIRVLEKKKEMDEQIRVLEKKKEMDEQIRVLEKKEEMERETEFWLGEGIGSSLSKEEIEEINSWVLEVPEPELGVGGVGGDMNFCGEEGMDLGDLGFESEEWGLSLEDLTESEELELTPEDLESWLTGGHQD